MSVLTTNYGSRALEEAPKYRIIEDTFLSIIDKIEPFPKPTGVKLSPHTVVYKTQQAAKTVISSGQKHAVWLAHVLQVIGDVSDVVLAHRIIVPIDGYKGVVCPLLIEIYLIYFGQYFG